ncbi:MAG TPA: DUF1697 domain-containing protein [Planctomycetota bacterium]|nr:DUF1697 domain-containing protein [Planctomycetota bacterium]
MGWIVFLRGANVGGHRTFRPSLLAEQLDRHDVRNVGAAGTFVVRGAHRPGTLAAEFQKRLPFETTVQVCPAREFLELVRRNPFGGAPARRGERRSVSIMDSSPRTPSGLPLRVPGGSRWQVQLVAVRGRFALCIWRRLGRALLYPNEVVEKHFGVRATTRGWDTVLKIRDLLS